MTDRTLRRSYFSDSLAALRLTSEEQVLGQLVKAHGFALEQLQRDAWLYEVRLFREFEGLDDARLALEYHVPRMGKRVDAVLMYHGVVFVIEFKVGARGFSRDGVDQVLDYCLDLKYFHAGSADRPLVPVLVATNARSVRNSYGQFPDEIYRPVLSNGADLSQTIQTIASTSPGTEFDPVAWEQSGYSPTPTIIEAAQALYAGHSVAEISRSDAANLTTTTAALDAVVNEARLQSRKAICFVTGVPGSGKTLAGLNLATQGSSLPEERRAVFLSGNGPLVRVLQEALARDQVANSGGSVKKSDALRRTRGFIQNIHHFRDEALLDSAPPVEKVVIFDEAQRAWDLTQTAKFMQSKKGLAGFNRSEPEFLIEVMDRHHDWAVIICLVGGGQEINTGEAGLPEWFRACGQRFVEWDVHVSDVLHEDEFSQGMDLYAPILPSHIHSNRNLHLAVSLRSFRSESLSAFVKALLDLDAKSACTQLCDLKGRYPVVLTRDLERARQWVRDHARGTERFGLLATSGALRLRPCSMDVKHEIDPVNYFLNPVQDVRSSFHLEDVATEFDAQGLELDWAIVGWDADLRLKDAVWTYHAFRGTAWQTVRDSTRQRYLRNAYRVLLTRARQGMVIFVPPGDPTDETRAPAFYDETYQYFSRIGIESC